MNRTGQEAGYATIDAKPGPLRHIFPTAALDLVLLGLIMAAGALLRLLWLDIYPTGWHHDEALMGVMAGQVYQGINRPIFFASYLGQEPLYLYLVAGMMALLGGDMGVLPVRLTSALAGLATIPVAYLLGRELFDRRIGLLTAAVMSTSFYQVMSGRDGYRSITLPLLAGLAVYLYWRSRRSSSPWPLVLAGLAAGGTWYTYLAGRAFPFIFAAYGVLSPLWNGMPGRRDLRRAALLAAIAIAAVLPLGYFWATHPGTFGARLGQIFFWGAEPAKGGPWAVLWGDIVKLIGIFTVYGEPLWRYNISGRPIFVWALAPAFWLGLAIVLWRATRRDPASLMVLSWLGVMSLPCILSEEAGAYTLRAMGMVPAFYLLPALGLVGAWDWLAKAVRSVPVRRPALLGTALAAVVVVADAGITYHDYFQVWARSFGGEYEDGTDFVVASRYLQSTADPQREDIIVGSEFLGHPVVAQLAPRVYDSLRWVDGNKAVVYRPEGPRDTLYVFPFTTRPWPLERFFPPQTEVAREYFQQGITPDQPAPALYTAYRLTPAQVKTQIDGLSGEPGTMKLNANVAGVATAVAARTAQRAVQGQALPVTALWRITASPGEQDYVFFAHLLDYQHKMWAQYNENGYPVAQWQPGDVLATRLNMPVADNVPPGRYRVEIGIFDRSTGTRLPLAGEGQKGSLLTIGTVKVATAVPSPPPTMAHPLDAGLGDSIRLVGFDTVPGVPDAAGARQFTVTLAWQAMDTPPVDYTVFVQLLTPDGQLAAQADALPQGGQQPTGSWDPGESVLDRHTLTLPADLLPGRYKLIAGMYRGDTGERLPVAAGDNYVSLTEIELPLP